jgi:gliding motility-associated-like protein
MRIARTRHLFFVSEFLFTLFPTVFLFITLSPGLLQAQTLVYSENFDTWTGSPACPGGWSCTTQGTCTAGASCYWNRNDAFGPLNQPSLFGCDSTGFYARCNTENLTFGDLPTLISPTLDLTPYPLSDSMTLSFCYINSSTLPIDGDGIIVSFSANAGASWAIQFLDLSTVHNSWTTIELEIPAAYKTALFRLKVEGVGNGSSGDIGIDQLTLTHEAASCANFSTTAIVSSDYHGQAISCFGASDGDAKAIPIGGQAPFSFLWHDGQTTPVATGLSAGLASVTVTDANSCVATGTILLSSPDSLQLNLSIPPSVLGYDVTCFGQATGAATAVVTGGTGSYAYFWSDGQTQAVATQLMAGPHTVTVTDVNGCTGTATALLTQPAPLQLTMTAQKPFGGFEISCFGKSDGTAEVLVAGGISPYAYRWSNDQLTASATGLRAGSYQIQVTDAAGCRDSATIILRSPDTLELVLSPSPATCADKSDGSILQTLSGGVAPYQYRWSDGSTQPDLQFASAGEYKVQVTDANGCAVAAVAVIGAPYLLTAEAMGTPPQCFGEANGFIVLAVSGGESPYDFLWSNGNLGAELFDLSAGRYTVAITDAVGCQRNLIIDLEDPQPLSLQPLSTPDNGLSTGTLLVNVTGGQEPYQYTWAHDPGETRAELDSLPPGTYRVTVTDANGCQIQENITVEASHQLDCLQIHTGFTPNGDGVNELWRIPCLPFFADNELTILNRWGQSIVQITHYQNEWDGTVNGVALPDGTYYYILKVNAPTDQRVFRGTVSIIR